MGTNLSSYKYRDVDANYDSRTRDWTLPEVSVMEAVLKLYW